MDRVTAAPPSATDGSLLRQFADGQERAAEALYRRYSERIRALAKARLPDNLTARMDPEDVVQSVFRSFFESARHGLYEVMDGESLWRLLAMVTVNKLRTRYTHHVAARRDVRATVPWNSDESSLSALDTELMEVVVRDVLEYLPISERAAVELRLDGYEVAEIAAHTGRSKRSIERSLQKARQHLTELLTPDPSNCS